MATEKSREYGGKSQSHREIDREIAALADRQHGVVAVWQLLELGLGRDAIQYRRSVGRLHRIHHGAYAVGYRTLTRHGHWMAAVLAYGPDAVLSHRSAAALWRVGQGSWKINVTVPQTRRSRPKTRVHTSVLHPEEITTHDAIPVTSVARTILDMAALLSREGLTRLIEEADRAGLADLRAIERTIARRPRVAGVARLGAVLADYRGPADTRSKLERDFRTLIANCPLPEPQYNVLVAGLEVDVFWPQWRLVVELDSRTYHATVSAFERDRLRDAILQKAGFRVLRITSKRLENEPAAILADIIAFSRT